MKMELTRMGAMLCCLWSAVSRAGETNGAPVLRMGEIVVTASRYEMLLCDTPDIVQVIDRRFIEEIHPSSTGEILEYATGVATSTGTGSGLPDRTVISVNGLPPQYTLVLLDGVPLLTDHIHTGQNLDLIPPSSIERIEIMRGAASAQYGTDAIGGIVNIVTRKCGSSREGDVGVVMGSHNTREGNLSVLLPAGGNVRISSFANWEESDGLPLKAPAHRVGYTGYERYSLLNRVEADLNEDTAIFAWLNWVHTDMDWRGDKVGSDLLTPVGGLRHAITPSLELNGQISFSEWDAELNEERNWLLKPEGSLRWQAGEAHVLLTGAEYRWNEFERTAVGAPRQQAYGVFAQDEWVASEWLILTSALRYDRVEGTDAAVSPKLSLMFIPQDRIRFRMSVGRGFHAPTLQERYEEGYGHGGSAYRFGNPDLDPEYSTTYTAGLEMKPADSVTFMVHGFYSDLDDMIVPVYEGPWAENPDIDVWRRRNIKNAEVFGGEAGMNVRVGKGIEVNGGYTYTDNEDKDTGRQLPYSPGSSVFGRVSVAGQISTRMRVNGFVGVRAGYDREAWNWQPAAGVDPKNPDGLTTTLKDYTQLDAGITLGIDKAYDVFFKVENILGEDVESLDDAFTVLDGEPFFRVGLTYRL